MSKQIFSKIAKIGEEVRLAETIKVELSLVNDIIDHSNDLIEISNETIGMKNDLKAYMRRLEGYQTDGVELFRALQKMQQELIGRLKELELQPTDSPQYKLAEKALSSWSDANSMKI